MSSFQSIHESWLSGYSRNSHADVWCDNKTCPNHDGTTVTYETEYGAGWYTPEECWICGGEWLEDRPVEDDPADPDLNEEIEDDATDPRPDPRQHPEYWTE